MKITQIQINLKRSLLFVEKELKMQLHELKQANEEKKY